MDAVGYRPHPAALPPGLPAPRYQRAGDWPADWHAAARLLPLPERLNHPVGLPVSGADEGGEIPEGASGLPTPAPSPRPSPVKHGRGRKVLRPVLAAAALGLCIAAAALTALRRPAPAIEIAASFKAPVMVLRASRDGLIASISVKPGEPVSPATVLFTLQVPAPPDPMATAMRERVVALQARVDALAAVANQPGPGGAVGRARLADLRRQRDTADAELAEAQQMLAGLAQAEPAELPVVAGVHGVILSLEAAEGTPATVGTVLVRMADCDHGYVALDGPAPLDLGAVVDVRLPNLPPLPATLRPGSRVAGQGAGLVADPHRAASPNSARWASAAWCARSPPQIENPPQADQ